VLVGNWLHTLAAHSWCLGAHAVAWPALTCPLTSGRACLYPTALRLFVKGIRLSFVSSCILIGFVILSQAAAEGFASVAACLRQPT